MQVSATKMTKHRQSREEWEQDLRDMQRNVVPHEGIHSAQVTSRRLAETEAPIKGPKQLVLFFAVLLSIAAAGLFTQAALAQGSYALGFAAGIALVAAVVFALLAFSTSRTRCKT